MPDFTISPDPFISASDLANYLGRPGVADDPAALIAIDSACDICRTTAEQLFNAGTATIALDGAGTDSLVLPQYPPRTVGTVTVNGETVTEYMIDERGCLLRGTAGGGTRPTWPLGRQNVGLTYTYGYSIAEFPRDVRMVALAVATRIYVQGPTTSESAGDVSASYAVASTELTSNEERILMRHRHPRSF